MLVMHQKWYVYNYIQFTLLYIYVHIVKYGSYLKVYMAKYISTDIHSSAKDASLPITQVNPKLY